MKGLYIAVMHSQANQGETSRTILSCIFVMTVNETKLF